MKKVYTLLFIGLFALQAAEGQFTKAGGGLGFTTGFPFHQ